VKTLADLSPLWDESGERMTGHIRQPSASVRLIEHMAHD